MTMIDVTDPRYYSNQTWTTPKFEDTTIRAAITKAKEKNQQANDLNDQAAAVLDKAEDWIALADELRKQDLTKVSQLPIDRQRYWKNKLEERITTYL